MTTTFTNALPDKFHSLVNQQALDEYGRSKASDKASVSNELTIANWFPTGPANHDMAECCLSGAWLLHNFLDDSHTISQRIHTAEGSFWHAIMHRLEGDFSNSKYWYRRVGQHPVLETIATRIGAGQPASIWAPENFVDRCQAELNGGTPDDELHSIAVVEWVALFEYCLANAT